MADFKDIATTDVAGIDLVFEIAEGYYNYYRKKLWLVKAIVLLVEKGYNVNGYRLLKERSK